MTKKEMLTQILTNTLSNLDRLDENLIDGALQNVLITYLTMTGRSLEDLVAGNNELGFQAISLKKALEVTVVDNRKMLAEIMQTKKTEVQSKSTFAGIIKDFKPEPLYYHGSF